MLSNEGLKPSKLKQHLETRHTTLAGKPVDNFKRKTNWTANKEKFYPLIDFKLKMCIESQLHGRETCGLRKP